MFVHPIIDKLDAAADNHLLFEHSIAVPFEERTSRDTRFRKQAADGVPEQRDAYRGTVPAKVAYQWHSGFSPDFPIRPDRSGNPYIIPAVFLLAADEGLEDRAMARQRIFIPSGFVLPHKIDERF